MDYKLNNLLLFLSDFKEDLSKPNPKVKKFLEKKDLSSLLQKAHVTQV